MNSTKNTSFSIQFSRAEILRKLRFRVVITRKSEETVPQQKPTPTRKLSGKAFIPRSTITIKIVNKYTRHPKSTVLKTVQNNIVI